MQPPYKNSHVSGESKRGFAPSTFIFPLSFEGEGDKGGEVDKSQMREIEASTITEAVARLCQEVNFELGEDVIAALRQAQQTEESELGKEVLRQLLEMPGLPERSACLCARTAAQRWSSLK